MRSWPLTSSCPSGSRSTSAAKAALLAHRRPFYRPDESWGAWRHANTFKQEGGTSRPFRILLNASQSFGRRSVSAEKLTNCMG